MDKHTASQHKKLGLFKDSKPKVSSPLKNEITAESKPAPIQEQKKPTTTTIQHHGSSLSQNQTALSAPLHLATTALAKTTKAPAISPELINSLMWNAVAHLRHSTTDPVTQRTDKQVIINYINEYKADLSYSGDHGKNTVLSLLQDYYAHTNEHDILRQIIDTKVIKEETATSLSQVHL